MLGDVGPDSLRCSKRDCLEDACRQIVWRNPTIHDESRKKVWLSCLDHEQFFLDYLGARNFPVHSDDFVMGQSG